MKVRVALDNVLSLAQEFRLQQLTNELDCHAHMLIGVYTHIHKHEDTNTRRFKHTNIRMRVYIYLSLYFEKMYFFIYFRIYIFTHAKTLYVQIYSRMIYKSAHIFLSIIIEFKSKF